ncbi:MAG: hypothetical protein A2Z94_02500 [Gallionellales bacterium GWA2_55_18]|nr:MAG: hypothetical protein A2Z94_02500 [Gallionellales bacterium GWA2_55_18]
MFKNIYHADRHATVQVTVLPLADADSVAIACSAANKSDSAVNQWFHMKSMRPASEIAKRLRILKHGGHNNF